MPPPCPWWSCGISDGRRDLGRPHRRQVPAVPWPKSVRRCPPTGGTDANRRTVPALNRDEAETFIRARSGDVSKPPSDAKLGGEAIPPRNNDGYPAPILRWLLLVADHVQAAP